MKRLISLSQIKLIGISALFFCLMLVMVKPKEPLPSSYMPPPVAIKNMTVGLNYQIADAMWLRALQDFDYCEAKINQTDCKGKSWLFQTLNLATEVDPVLHPDMYKSAGLALTVIISDYAGASVIFDKSVIQYPRVWRVTYTAAYHALFEEKDKLKASRLYASAARDGAPAWVHSFAGRLALEGGAEDYAEEILEGMIATNVDEKFIKRLKDKMAQVSSIKNKK